MRVQMPSPGRLAVLGAGACAALVAVAVAADGDLRQKPGRAGCVSFTGSDGACRRGPALKFPEAVVASPDAKNVYVAAQSGGVAVFDRAASGALTQKRGRAGCVSQTIRSRRACALAEGLRAPIDVDVSPDGRHVYVAALGSDAVAVFDRRTPGGALTQKRGRAACASKTGGPCARARGLDGPLGVAGQLRRRERLRRRARRCRRVRPRRAQRRADAEARRRGLRGRRARPGGRLRERVDRRRRGRTGRQRGRAQRVRRDGARPRRVRSRPWSGALAAKAGPAGCIADDAFGGECATVAELQGVQAVVASADGRNVYAASLDALVTFDRDAASGALVRKPGSAGCIAPRASDTCAAGRAASVPRDLALSPDGSALLAAFAASDAVGTFDRDPVTGELRQRAGRSGCASATGNGGRCAKARALRNPHAVTVSPDGRSVYVAASSSSAVGIYDRR